MTRFLFAVVAAGGQKLLVWNEDSNAPDTPNIDPMKVELNGLMGSTSEG